MMNGNPICLLSHLKNLLDIEFSESEPAELQAEIQSLFVCLFVLFILNLRTLSCLLRYSQSEVDDGFGRKDKTFEKGQKLDRFHRRPRGGEERLASHT